ncbi:hypothetical protein V6N12_047721 [Hibiscus sabdariffa]|uniref:F-box domain-containing protein n=1 Tax=Hibiscus sabdariffa TaxID=183260 RepID=A0ABR2CTT7_9ROSI
MQGLSKTGRSDVPEVLVFEILHRLPVKSLTRFRCVCKPWSSSFQTPLFITKHHNHHLRHNNLNLLLNRSHGNRLPYDTYFFSQLSTDKGHNFSVKQTVHLPFFENFLFYPQFLGPCNGILCLSDFSDKVALWNPSTREFKILPQSSIQCPPSASYIPYYSVYRDFGCSGFGYDSQTDDYKVVRFAIIHFGGYDEHDPGQGYLEFDPENKVELYSLRSDSWKEISLPEGSAYGDPLFNNYVNGFYYWLGSGYYDYENHILSFDMVNEKFSILPLPLPMTSGSYYLELLDFNGLLGALLPQGEGTEKSFDLWVMNGSWTKQFTIDSVPGVERVLGFWKNGELFLDSPDHELSMKNILYVGCPEGHQIDIERGTTTKERRCICMLDMEWFSCLNCALKSSMSLIVECRSY